MAVLSFKELLAWQKAIDLVVAVYEATEPFPKQETFGLTNQLRRAAVSVPSNIAEGQGRGAGNDFIRFLRMARGSLQEVDTQLLIAVRLRYLTTERHECMSALVADVGRLINALIRSVEPCIPN